MSSRPNTRSVPVGVCLASAALLLASGSGCVERELVGESEPSGALVMMNDQELGRTPASRDFQWYGTYDVKVRLEGYETIRTTEPVIAPPWLWFPLDFVAEILPITIRDVHTVRYELKPTTDETIEPGQLVRRADALRDRLESGERPPTPRPSTTPTSKPAR